MTDEAVQYAQFADDFAGHDHDRGLLLDFQARHEGRLSSIAASSTCTATLPSLNSSTTTGLRMAWTMPVGPVPRLKVWRASV